MCAVKLLCITEKCQNGETINVSIPLSHVISDSLIDTDCKVIFDANVIECNTTLINSRKVSVKVRVMLETKICKYKNLWLTTDVPEMDNTYCLKKDFHDEYIACIEEKQLRLVENISIDTDEIEPLRWSVDFITEDVKNIKEKVMVKTPQSWYILICICISEIMTMLCRQMKKTGKFLTGLPAYSVC